MQLHLKLKGRWFREIMAGTKTREYRQVTAYWQKRLEGRTYETVVFRNGYEPDSPLMEVEWLGMDTSEREGETVYAIRLGRIVRTKWLQNLRLPEASPEINYVLSLA